MGSARRLATTLVLVVACSTEPGAAPVDASSDEAADAGAIDDATTTDAAAPDTGPTHAPFGLDARPPNATCRAPARPATTAAVSLQRVFANVAVSIPLTMAQAPGDPSRWFVASQNGQLVSFGVNDASGTTTVTLDLTKQSPPVFVGVEDGFLGFAFHPKFAQNGLLFVSYTISDGAGGVRSLIARFTSNDGGKTFGDFTPVLGPFTQPPGTHGTHKGGTIAFGNDGFLYASFGDGDDSSYGQRADTFFGKILRIDVGASGGAYGIPDGNPYKDGGGEPATFARGFRNPFRFSIDRGTGDVWVGDVGNAAWEEVDVAKAGGNYGWPCREGAHDFDSDPTRCPTKLGLVDPASEYGHTTAEPLKAIIGGVVYRGKAIPSLVGTYIFGDYETGEVWGLAFDPVTGAPAVTQLNPTGPTTNWVAFAEDLDGEVYAVSRTDYAFYKIVPSGPPSPSTFPDRLTKTGCFGSPAMIPYAVNAPLWSDGADKERALALPDGATIHVGSDGDFDLPIGSVVLKTFSLGAKRVETRMLVRHDDGAWAGYTYEWLDDGSDALLLPSGKTTQTWRFPSRSDCVQCHTSAAGRTLGLELGQLNRDFTYASTNRISNQLATLDHIGMFDSPLSGAPDTLVAYPDPAGSAPVDARARAYLHANCSMCHRPGTAARATFDVRFATPLHDASLCGVASQIDDLGIAGAKLLAPGAPALSLLSVRARAMGAARMPPLASAIVDVQGLAVVDDWIRGVASCP